MTDREPSSIKPEELGLNSPFPIPRDIRGRIRWKVLEKDPDILQAYIFSEAEEIIKKGGRFTRKELIMAGRRDLVRAVSVATLTCSQVRDGLGLSGNYKGRPTSITTGEDNLPRTKGGRIYWILLKDDKERMMALMEQEAKRLMTDAQYLEGKGEKMKGLPGLFRAARQYYPGGVYALEEKIGICIKERPNGFWKKNPEEILEQEARIFLEKEGDLTRELLEQRDQTRFANAIHRYYPGGLSGLRSKIGLGVLSKPDGYWTPENIEIEARAFIDREGTLSAALLRKCKQSGLAAAIGRRYPGGMEALRLKNGLEVNYKSRGSWTKEKILADALEFYRQNGRISHLDLVQARMSGLSAAIRKYYPGRWIQLKEDIGIKIRQNEMLISAEEANSDLDNLFVGN